MLGKADVTVDERQYFKQRPTVQEVRAVAARLPGGVRDMLSTRSRRYKELALVERTLTDDELVSLLADEPGLWRRPIILTDAGATVGYNAKTIEALVR